MRPEVSTRRAGDAGRTPGGAFDAAAAGPLAALATAAVVVLGVWVAGGVVTDRFRVAAALTAAWFAVAAGLAFVVGRRRPRLRWWIGAAYLLTAGAIGGYLAYTTNRTTTVHERLARGAAVASGAFTSGEHPTRGTARIVALRDGRRVLTLSGFSTAAGPDVRVRLVPGRTRDGGAEGNVDLGGLKGNVGNQQYALPADAPARAVSVVIWCRAFSAEFGTAFLS